MLTLNDQIRFQISGLVNNSNLKPRREEEKEEESEVSR